MLPIPRLIPVRRDRARSVLALLTILLAAAALVAGCGGKQAEDSGALLATVGDQEIRGAYYEDRLRRLTEDELPRDKDNRLLDMATPEGKGEFLTTLINKELMVQKATALGYANDARIVDARKAMLAYEASLAMWRHVVGKPSNELSHEEVDAIYSRLGEQRRIRYLVCNFEEDAKAAREMALGGADWEDVASRYHDGGYPPNGKLEMVIGFGRFNPDFEGPIFAAEVGSVTEPVYTSQGWWVVRVEGSKQVEVPPLDDVLANILDLTYNRKVAALREAFLEGVYAKHKLQIEDEALLKAWQGLPAGEMILDPATNEPVPREQLKPLDIAIADLDLPFYSYELDGKLERFTLGDYKIRYDRMNTFQRPKKEAMLGGLRTAIIEELGRPMLDVEAREGGFYEDPEALAVVNFKAEEMIVTALYNDLVTYDERITPEQLKEHWDEFHSLYDTPELRSGRLVIAADEAAAGEARALIVAGTPWGDVVARFGTDETNMQRSGKVDEVSSRSQGPVRDAFFALEPGQLSEPFPAGDGRWAVVLLENVVPGQPVTMAEATPAAGQRIRIQRKEQAFQDLLAQWAAEIGVVRYDENLSQVKSWKELTHVEAPGPEVPRKNRRP